MSILKLQLKRHVPKINLKVKKTLNQWEKWMRSGAIYSKPLSENTINIYSYNIIDFVCFLKPDFSNIEDALLMARGECERNQDVKRLHQYDAIRSYIKALVAMKIVEPSVLEELKDLRPKRFTEPKRTVPTERDIEKLLKANMKSTGNSPYDKLLNKTLILFLINTGLRAEEFCSLELDDFDSKNRVLKIKKSKGNKSRELGLNDMAYLVIQEYLKQRPKTRYKNIFLLQNGKPIRRKILGQKFKRLCDKEGLDLSLHSLRRFFCSYWVSENNIPLPIMQRCLGHSDVKTTVNSYFCISQKQITNAMKGWQGLEYIQTKLAL